MKILFTINDIPNNISEKFGIISNHSISWVDALKDELKKKHNLAIAFPFSKRQIEKKELDGIVYIGFPSSIKKKSDWLELFKIFTPDLIHIFGTEKKHNYYLVKHFSREYPILLSIQGIMVACAKNYYAGLSLRDIAKNITIRDIILHDGIISQRRAFDRQAHRERYIIENIKNVEGRSDWDHQMVININDKVRYFDCPRVIRQDFYKNEWNINKYIKYSIFLHQGGYPLKGFHIVLDALRILKKKYDVKLFIAGKNCFERKTLKKKLSTPGYVRLINRKIDAYDLRNNIVFLGALSSGELSEKLSKMNVCIISSSMENASNSLAEAMLLGVPCVASYVGGNPYMLDYGKCGLLYDYNDPIMLAYSIEKYFENDDLCNLMSARGKDLARDRHKSETIIDKLNNIYEDICLSK